MIFQTFNWKTYSVFGHLEILESGFIRTPWLVLTLSMWEWRVHKPTVTCLSPCLRCQNVAKSFNSLFLLNSLLSSGKRFEYWTLRNIFIVDQALLSAKIKENSIPCDHFQVSGSAVFGSLPSDCSCLCSSTAQNTVRRLNLASRYETCRPYKSGRCFYETEPWGSNFSSDVIQLKPKALLSFCLPLCHVN